MEPSRDEILFATLESLKPAPSPAFAAELDARAAEGFPRRSGAAGVSPLSRLAVRARSLRPRQIVFAGGGVALAAIAATTVVIAAGSGSGGSDALVVNPVARSAGDPAAPPRHLDHTPKPIEEAFGAAGSSKGSASGGSSSNGVESAGIEYESEVPTAAGAEVTEPLGATDQVHSSSAASGRGSGPYASQAHRREVEYAAEMVLGTKPEDVGDAAGKVFEVVHQYGGIVLDSSVRGGSEGDSGAQFELLVPSARLSDALAAFSAIADVRSRHETSNDITAPTLTTTELLQDSHARVEALLNELADSETEAERVAAEAKLRGERRHAARLKGSLTNLQRRASFSHVSLRIESGASDSPQGGGAWDVGDAFHDAGHILTVAAGVVVVGLAVIAPIALVLLLAWLANRLWVRQRRERALG